MTATVCDIGTLTHNGVNVQKVNKYTNIQNFDS